MLIEGENLDKDKINACFVAHFDGDCLLPVGGQELIKTASGRIFIGTKEFTIFLKTFLRATAKTK